MNNFYATDSLSYFIEKSLKRNSILYRIRNKWRDVQNFWIDYTAKCPMFLTSFVQGATVGVIIYPDPTLILNYVYDVKLASIFGKAVVPYLKAFSIAGAIHFFPKTTGLITDKIKRTYLYKNRYVLSTRRLLQELPVGSIPGIQKELTPDEQQILQQIFDALYDLKSSRSQDERLSPYYFLYERLCFSHINLP